jgi:hypothetical protein
VASFLHCFCSLASSLADTLFPGRAHAYHRQGVGVGFILLAKLQILPVYARWLVSRFHFRAATDGGRGYGDLAERQHRDMLTVSNRALELLEEKLAICRVQLARWPPV